MRLAAGILMALPALLPAQTPQTAPQFDVVSIRPNNSLPIVMETPPPRAGRLNFRLTTLKQMVAIAYSRKPWEIVSGPAWMASDRYDVAATTTELSLSPERYHSMLQSMLRDRFQLAAHTEMREANVYALVPAKKDLSLPTPKDDNCFTLTPNAPLPATPPTLPPCGSFLTTSTKLLGSKVTTSLLADRLSSMVGRNVIDKTGYADGFDVHLEFSGESTVFKSPAAPDTTNPDNSGPSIFTALEEQLGLKLQSQKGTVEVLVVDRAAKPSAN